MAFKKKVKPAAARKKCISCPPERCEKSISDFYTSQSPFHADGKLPMCKECVKERVYDEETDYLDIEKFKDLLRQVDRPFIQSVMESAIRQYNAQWAGQNVRRGQRAKIIGFYFKNINSLQQFKALDWRGGIEWEVANSKVNERIDVEKGYAIEGDDLHKQLMAEKKPIYIKGSDNFEATPEIIKLFGEGYTKDMYRRMSEKYNVLKAVYPEFTAFHIEALVTYVRFKVREELATADGDIDSATKWAGEAAKAADRAKINPKQMSKSDLEGGLNSFSELFQSVEIAAEVIPILPKFRYNPHDAPDMLLWNYVNYMRRLEDKPACTYEEIYKFYDESKAEYLKQHGDPYGIFEEDPSQENRGIVKEFINIEEDMGDSDEDE